MPDRPAHKQGLRFAAGCQLGPAAGPARSPSAFVGVSLREIRESLEYERLRNARPEPRGGRR